MSSTTSLRLLSISLLAACLLAACATAPRLEAPKVAVARVELDWVSPVSAQFTVTVALANPNDREIAVDAIDANLRLEEVAVGTAHLAAPLRMTSRSDATASLVARADWAALFKAVSEVARRTEAQRGEVPSVHYAVSGVATLDGGLTIPFSRTGEFPLSRKSGQTP
jgi:LEA14-like dessication related protein